MSTHSPYHAYVIEIGDVVHEVVIAARADAIAVAVPA